MSFKVQSGGQFQIRQIHVHVHTFHMLDTFSFSYPKQMTSHTFVTFFIFFPFLLLSPYVFFFKLVRVHTHLSLCVM